MNVLVSSCFLLPTRYDGKAQTTPQINELINLLKSYNVNIIPVCPEQLGGLTTPRTPAEIRGKIVISKTGEDVTSQFKRGACNVVELARILDIDFAILKERSPSCGVNQIYDGTFTNTTINGQGLTTAALINAGIKVYSETCINTIREILCKSKI